MEPLTDYEHAHAYYFNFRPDGWYLEYRFDALAEARKVVSDIEDLAYGFRSAARENLAIIGTVRESDAQWALLVAGRIPDKDVLDIHERAIRGGGRFHRLAKSPTTRLEVGEWGPTNPRASDAA